MYGFHYLQRVFEIGWAKDIFHALQIGLSKEKQVLKQCLETETFK